MRNPNTLIVIIIVVIILIFAVVRAQAASNSKQEPQVSGAPVATVVYSCNAGKSISASFYNGASVVASNPDQSSVPTGIVALVFSGGTTINLAETTATDGARYANYDNSLVFWSKSDMAIILEDSVEMDYTGCTSASSISATNVSGSTTTPDSTSTTAIQGRPFRSDANKFSLTYPVGYAVG